MMPPSVTSAAFIAVRLVADSFATVSSSSSPSLARATFRADLCKSVTAVPPQLLVRELSTIDGFPLRVLFSRRSASVCCGGWSSLSICCSGSPPLDSGLSPK